VRIVVIGSVAAGMSAAYAHAEQGADLQLRLKREGHEGEGFRAHLQPLTNGHWAPADRC
jgi:glycine/D-amino acid oxidase-like deaminating enzyme